MMLKHRIKHLKANPPEFQLHDLGFLETILINQKKMETSSKQTNKITQTLKLQHKFET